MKAKAAEVVLAVGGLGVYADFFSITVPTPLGLIMALGLLPTGDLIRWVTAWMDRHRPVRPAVSRGEE